MAWKEIPIKGGWDSQANDARTVLSGGLYAALNWIRVKLQYWPLLFISYMNTIKTPLRIFTHSLTYTGAQTHYLGCTDTIEFTNITNTEADITGLKTNKKNNALGWDFLEYGDWLIVNGCSDYTVTTSGVYYPKILKDINAYTISSLTRSGTTATAVTSSAHGLVTGDLVTIVGATQTDYNLSNVAVTVTNSTTFTYTVANSPVTPATGTPKMYKSFTYLDGWGDNYANAMCINNDHLVFGDVTINGTRSPKRIVWSALANIETFPPNLEPISQLTLSRGTADNKKVLNSQFAYKASDGTVQTKASSEVSLTGVGISTIYLNGWGAWRFFIDNAGTITVTPANNNLAATQSYPDEAAAIKAVTSLATPSGTVPIGYVTVRAAGGFSPTTFVPGTDSLKPPGNTNTTGGSGTVAKETNYYVDLANVLDGLGANEADFQDLADINGPVVQLVNMGEYFVVVGRDSISTLTYIGQPLIYQCRQNVVKDIMILPGSFIAVNNVGYFVSPQGIYSFDGNTATKVKDFDGTVYAWVAVRSVPFHDIGNKAVMWTFSDLLGPATLTTVFYNYDENILTYNTSNNQDYGITAIGGHDGGMLSQPGKINNFIPSPVVHNYYYLNGSHSRIGVLTSKLLDPSGTSVMQLQTLVDYDHFLEVSHIRIYGYNCSGSTLNVYVNNNLATYNSTTGQWDILISSNEISVLIEASNTYSSGDTVSIRTVMLDVEEISLS